MTAPITLTLTLEQYSALAALARKGTTTPNETRVLETFLKDIETTNGVNRYVLLVQWQNMNGLLPPTTEFPAVWPPELRAKLERTDRPIAKADVLAVLAQQANNPTNILVTPDIGGLVGWSKLDDYFIT